MAGLKGTNNVLRNLKREVSKMEKRATQGVWIAALRIKRDSVKMTPVKYGNLRNSAYVIITGGQGNGIEASFKGPEGTEMMSQHSAMIAKSKRMAESSKDKISGIIGYSAHYAIYVHEMPSHYNFNEGQDHFLLKSLIKNREYTRKTLKKYAKLR